MKRHKILSIGNGTYREALSFTAFDTTNHKLTISAAGVNYKAPKNAKESLAIMEQFGVNADRIDPSSFPDGVYPKPEDFVSVPFRLLSATTVAAGSWRATDFSDEAVLKESAPLLDKKPLYTEHNTILSNWIGVVNAPQWSSERIATDGSKIPAGIDGIVSIDAKMNPRIARGVLLGGIFSNSVTVVFDWKPSHEYEKAWQFYEKVGTMHGDGTMVRRIVTKIHDYYESSLVWLGADPYAKMIDDEGNLVNVDKTNVYQKSFSLESEEVKNSTQTSKSFSIASALDKNVLNLSLQNAHLANSGNVNENITIMKKELLSMLLATIGIANVEELTEAHIANLQVKPTEKELSEIASAQNLSKQVVSLMKSVDEKAENFEQFAKEHSFAKNEQLTKLKTLQAQYDELAKENTNLKATASLGSKVLESQRKEVERLYGVTVGGKTNEAVLRLIAKADLEELQAMAEQYGGKAVTEFGGSCKSCGSKEISFQSSVSGQEKPKTPAVTSPSMAELRSKYRQA